MGEFTILNDDTIAELRALNDSNLPHLATITRDVQSGAREGGSLVDETPVEVFSDRACRLSPAGAQATVAEADQAEGRGSWTLTFVAGTIVPENAIAEVTGETNGVVWTRRVRIAGSRSTRGTNAMAKYDAVDVGPADE